MSIQIYDSLQELKSLIQDKLSNRWLDIHEVAQFTSVSESTIRRAVNRGELKVSKVTGKLLFKLIDIDRWLNG